MSDDWAVVVVWFQASIVRPGWLRMRGEMEDFLGSAEIRVRWIVQRESKTVAETSTIET